MDRSEAGRYLKGILYVHVVWCVCVCVVCVCVVCVYVCVCGMYVDVYTQVMQIVQCVKHSWSHSNLFSDRTQ